MRLFFIILIVILQIMLFVLPKTELKKFSSQSLGQTRVSESFPKLLPQPQIVQDQQKVGQITAKSAIVTDFQTGTSLYEKNADLRLLPASITKLMTAQIGQENCAPDKVIKIENIIGDGTQMGLTLGDVVTFKDLLYGMLVSSGNDAAYAVATSCSNSYDQFIIAMNQKAQDLGMKNTRFANPAGFDSDNQYSTARDLAKLAKVVVANPLISKIVSTQSIVLTDVSGNKTYYLENINKLLGHVEGVEGVKTGQTEGALENLVTKTTRGGNTILVPVLGSNDRFEDTRKLIEWAFANHKWLAP